MDYEAEGEGTNYGEAVGRKFEDKLLLALIDAHQAKTSSPASDAKRRTDRLREAKQALFGENFPEGRPLDSDETILRWMGATRYEGLARRNIAEMKGESTSRLISARQLAERAVERFGLPISSIDRLRKKFADQEAKWIDVAMLHDDVPEQLEFEALRKIQKILATHGIRMDVSRIER